MTTYVLVEGYGEVEAIPNLLTRLDADLQLGLAPFAAIRAPKLATQQGLTSHAELVRRRPTTRALLALRDDEDGCPKDDAPVLAAALRPLALPFPSAVVLAYREYETLFLPCIASMAGRQFEAAGFSRPGLRPDARYDGADFEATRGVKEWLTRQMAPGRAYKPTVDQMPLTRMVDFATLRASGLPWFGSLERALKFLAANLGTPSVSYPPTP